MQNIYLQKIILENYRNFIHFEIEATNNIILIIGENGIGKTNILEAISLFFPGRGLRGAKFDEICKNGQNNWRATALFQSKIGVAELCSQFKLNSTKRSVQFNNKRIPSSELCKFINLIWLTPQMEDIFLEVTSSRRKFFDRIVYNFYPSHAVKINEYEYYLSERIKILQQDIWDESWLKILEQKIADVSLIITDYRLKTLDQMQEASEEIVNEFPKAVLSVEGELEGKIRGDIKDDEILTYITTSLLNSRLKDKFSGRTNFGIHRSDFLIVHKEKNKLAKFCSTGEQKAMLISIILAQVNAGMKATNTQPILLLDEIFVHLDDRRKEYLIAFFKSAKLQIWITATDLKGLDSIVNYADITDLNQNN